jgi:hypothetical protein
MEKDPSRTSRSVISPGFVPFLSDETFDQNVVISAQAAVVLIVKGN